MLIRNWCVNENEKITFSNYSQRNIDIIHILMLTKTTNENIYLLNENIWKSIKLFKIRLKQLKSAIYKSNIKITRILQISTTDEMKLIIKKNLIAQTQIKNHILISFFIRNETNDLAIAEAAQYIIYLCANLKSLCLGKVNTFAMTMFRL